MSFRTPFENLINSLNSNFKVIQEPKREVNLGAPDFKAFFGSRKVGSIETKKFNENLDEILKTEQIKKYVESIDNLILTNYSRFILIRKGNPEIDFTLFSTSDLDKGNVSLSDEYINSVTDLFDLFFSYKHPTIKSAEELARELAKKAKLLKEIVKKQLDDDMGRINNDETPSSVYDFYLGIKELIKDIKIEDCADAYAQTVTYSLFLARKNSLDKDIDRETAYIHIPKTIGILRRIFINISGDEFPSNISWIIDDILDILNASDINKILYSLDKRGKKDKDPIIFFYEDFLNFYEPEKRKQRGVYYTPRPVVNFMVNSTHLLLKKYFDKSYGLADDTVTVLDPATGTGTFFWITFLVVLNELVNQGLKGLIKDKIENHLLKHFYGFEILITPYVIANLKLSDLLQQWHYDIKDNDKIQIFLTNTLEPPELEKESLMPFFREISNENKVTSKIKLAEPVIAIIGNPPYAGMSSNKGKWIDDLLKNGYKRADGTKDNGYYMVDNEPLGERNPKWLQDDYVKFIRFAQWKIDRTGEGIVSFITNHSFLDNPTFRGMRESLLESFDRIYVLNLHGNLKKKEKCPNGSKDENVFDIQQGVAISIFIKNREFTDKKVLYHDLWGLREEKYKWLDRHSVYNIEWEEIEPISNYYFFIPMDTSLISDFENFLNIKDIFPVNNPGIVTSRDSLTIQFTNEEIENVINDFASLNPEDARKKYNLPKDVTDWKISWAQEDLKSTGLDKNKIVPIHYRPFDIRYTYYTGKSKGFHCRPRADVMQHMEKDNLGLIIGRQWGAIGSNSYDIVFVSDKIIDFNLFRRGGELIFPLYVYDGSERVPNIDLNVFEHLNNQYGNTNSPEEIFYYIYAILHSPKYREKYEPLLKYDFPRIPFVDDYDTFKQLSELGKELVELHLMKKNLPIHTKFEVEGSNILERVKFEKGNVWINKEQFFEGVPKNVWDFNIGGYPVLEQFLKDKNRKNRKLTSNEIMNFLRTVEIIKLTIVIMNKIDGIY